MQTRKKVTIKQKNQNSKYSVETYVKVKKNNGIYIINTVYTIWVMVTQAQTLPVCNIPLVYNFCWYTIYQQNCPCTP